MQLCHIRPGVEGLSLWRKAILAEFVGLSTSQANTVGPENNRVLKGARDVGYLPSLWTVRLTVGPNAVEHGLGNILVHLMTVEKEQSG